jgi:hypothetical protein
MYGQWDNRNDKQKLEAERADLRISLAPTPICFCCCRFADGTPLNGASQSPPLVWPSRRAPLVRQHPFRPPYLAPSSPSASRSTRDAGWRNAFAKRIVSSPSSERALALWLLVLFAA